jgi:hypothetical protein
MNGYYTCWNTIIVFGLFGLGLLTSDLVHQYYQEALRLSA